MYAADYDFGVANGTVSLMNPQVQAFSTNIPVTLGSVNFSNMMFQAAVNSSNASDVLISSMSNCGMMANGWYSGSTSFGQASLNLTGNMFTLMDGGCTIQGYCALFGSLVVYNATAVSGCTGLVMNSVTYGSQQFILNFTVNGSTYAAVLNPPPSMAPMTAAPPGMTQGPGTLAPPTGPAGTPAIAPTMLTAAQPLSASPAPTLSTQLETAHTTTLSGDWVRAIQLNASAVIASAQAFLMSALSVSNDSVSVDSVAAGSLIINYRVKSVLPPAAINALISKGSTTALAATYQAITGLNVSLSVTGSSTNSVQMNTRTCGSGCIALVIVGIVVVIAAVICLYYCLRKSQPKSTDSGALDMKQREMRGPGSAYP